MARKVEHALTEEQVREALKAVKFPGFSRDIVSFGIVKSISITENNDVSLALHVTTRDPAVPNQIRQDVESAVKKCDGIGRVNVEMTSQPAPQQGPMPMAGSGIASAQPQIDGVKHIVAVGSGKGGVGKSTVAVNLACALTKLGRKIGVMDADIYGPSVPKMMGAVGRPTISDDKLDPVENFGLKMMSMALLLEGNSPVIWRGPMIMKAIQQFSLAVNWGELDVLIVDLPPGTGDAQLSLAQTIALDGGIIVTTPQDVALEVARRGIAMFEKVNVKILGIIENMSYYVCPHCGERDDVFGHGGGKQEAERMEVPFLGEIPLFAEIRICGDKGLPIVVAEPNSEPTRAFLHCGETILRQLEK
ncbi:MAG TPA: Mrp/NBP35 family ATP-binding protein [Verrucomicrobiae bacterium]|nr:Mrp/NBP35 family ATP-binding protein [Verrucomicrobiae bacterium]